MHCRAGPVGRLLPGIAWPLDAVEGIDEGGRLVVAGPNVMKGYLSTATSGAIDAPPGGWYDTGDIVAVDAEGYVTILGRAKPFAKIPRHTLSLGPAQRLAPPLCPDQPPSPVPPP